MWNLRFKILFCFRHATWTIYYYWTILKRRLVQVDLANFDFPIFCFLTILLKQNTFAVWQKSTSINLDVHLPVIRSNRDCPSVEDLVSITTTTPKENKVLRPAMFVILLVLWLIYKIEIPVAKISSALKTKLSLIFYIINKEKIKT